MTKLLTLTPLSTLPKNFLVDTAIALEIQDGVAIFRASNYIQQRIESLFDKRNETILTETEEQELDNYAEIDDYLSFVNRMIRNNFMIESINKAQPEIQYGA